MPISLAGSARPANISAPVAQYSQPITHNSHTLRLLIPQGKAHGLLCRVKQGALTVARHLARALCQRHGDEFAQTLRASRPERERAPTPITRPVISSPRQAQLQSAPPARPSPTPLAQSAKLPLRPMPLLSPGKPIVPPKPKNIPPPRNTLAPVVTTATTAPAMQPFAPVGVPPPPPPPPLNWRQQPLTATVTPPPAAAKAPPMELPAPRPNQSVVNDINAAILKKFAAVHAENDDDDDVAAPDDDVGEIEAVIVERQQPQSRPAAMPDLTQHPLLQS